MSFATVAALEAHVADRSYIEGYSFSAKDSAIFAAFSLPCPVAFPNAHRWYVHIAALQGVAASLAPAVAHAAPEGDSDVYIVVDDEQAPASTDNPAVVVDPFLDAASDVEGLAASSSVSEDLRRVPAALYGAHASPSLC